MASTTLDRTDTRLSARILRQLEYTRDVDAHDIGIYADDGFVRLLGSVETYPEKLAAEDAVKRLYGVRRISNEIRVRAASVPDAELLRSVNDTLHARHTAPAGVRASVQDGIVKLTGTVAWLHQRSAAAALIAYLPGVKGIENRIQLAASDNQQVSRDIVDAAIMQTAGLDWKRIAVDTSGGIVRLSGAVYSLIEREEAERAAWSLPGVIDVHNDLDVVARRWW